MCVLGSSLRCEVTSEVMTAAEYYYRHRFLTEYVCTPFASNLYPFKASKQSSDQGGCFGGWARPKYFGFLGLLNTSCAWRKFHVHFQGNKYRCQSKPLGGFRLTQRTCPEMINPPPHVQTGFIGQVYSVPLTQDLKVMGLEAIICFCY